MSRHNLQSELNDAPMDAPLSALYLPAYSGRALHAGITVPTATTAGYVPGALFLHVDSTDANDLAWLNIGTAASCLFASLVTSLIGHTTHTTNPTSSTCTTVSATAKRFLNWFFKGTASSGDYRGLYLRLFLTAGGTGEALRAFTTVESNTPDAGSAVNGAHISLNFGASAGNIVGMGTAVRGTVHVPGRALGGTVAAVQGEIYADSDASDVSGVLAMFRGIVDGDGTGKAVVDGKSFFLDLVAGAGAYNSGELVVASNDGTITGGIKVRINGATRYVALLDSPVAP